MLTIRAEQNKRIDDFTRVSTRFKTDKAKGRLVRS